jgi:hypothetical protein
MRSSDSTGKGRAVVGIVGQQLDERAVRQKAQEAAEIEGNYETARGINKALDYISRSLSDVSEGAEIRVERRGAKVRLVVPPEARAQRPPIKAEDGVAFNGHVKPKAFLNAHGTVESISGRKAKVKLDAGDRRRITEATGKDYPESMTAPLDILDKLQAGTARPLWGVPRVPVRRNLGGQLCSPLRSPRPPEREVDFVLAHRAVERRRGVADIRPVTSRRQPCLRLVPLFRLALPIVSERTSLKPCVAVCLGRRAASSAQPS